MKTTSPPRARIFATESRTSAQTRAINASSGGGRDRASHTRMACSRSRSFVSISRQRTYWRSA